MKQSADDRCEGVSNRELLSKVQKKKKKKTKIAERWTLWLVDLVRNVTYSSEHSARVCECESGNYGR